ncbi:hypothetical protein [Micromonospora luteifusca]|uniref:hypothetical protein n=1 Tax=Micromonospora luteifusca TaxID=709860 RepID=UPI0033BC8A36
MAVDWDLVLRRADISAVIEARLAIEGKAAAWPPRGAHVAEPRTLTRMHLLSPQEDLP